MNWLARLRDQRDEEGTTLVELVMASMILIIGLSITLFTINYILAAANNETGQGVASETLHGGLGQFENYVEGAVAPCTAAAASGGFAATSTSTTTSVPAVCGSYWQSQAVWGTQCWGTGASESVNSTSTTGLGYAGAAQAEGMAIAVAHDFDLWFCGYQPNASSSSINIYEATIPVSTCQHTVAAYGSHANGDCTLEILNWGTSPSDTTSTVVATVNNVYCDAYCQGSSGSTTDAAVGKTVPWSSTVAIACANQTTAPSGGCSSATAPLFSYYGTSGATASALNSVVTSGGSPSYTPLDTSSTFGVSNLENIHAVAISVLELSPVDSATSITGTSINDQLWLNNLSSADD